MLTRIKVSYSLIHIKMYLIPSRQLRFIDLRFRLSNRADWNLSSACFSSTLIPVDRFISLLSFYYIRDFVHFCLVFFTLLSTFSNVDVFTHIILINLYSLEMSHHVLVLKSSKNTNIYYWQIVDNVSFSSKYLNGESGMKIEFNHI